MTELNELQSNQELTQAWEHSVEEPVLVFKHSTTCPISATAFEQYQTFLESAGNDLNSYVIKVIENRDISNQLAEDTGVKHESPQVFLIRNKGVLWHTSHSNITADAIAGAMQRAR
ncbi:bacillithiol system redox-active protein YtxJ [Lentibacillus halophilus]|uniref:Bacillithiol system redox-active protein YtxJ n=1 Tax=Lentibacillus halophilus TaxID=295065 RepID=A0ABN0Z2Z8_9BACI